MPIPKPKDNENRQQFISRCIKTLSKKEAEKFEAKGQKAAVCYSQWRRDDSDQSDSSNKKKNSKTEK